MCLKRYFYKSCRRTFNDKTDTILHYPRLSLRPWLSIHRGICRDNLKLYLAVFKICRRSRNANPIQAIIEITKTIHIITATTYLVKSEN